MDTVKPVHKSPSIFNGLFKKSTYDKAKKSKELAIKQDFYALFHLFMWNASPKICTKVDFLAI